jgi:hypothetical protein
LQRVLFYRFQIELEKEEKMWKSEEGSATAEYAIATMAAVGFAGLLVVIMRSEEVKQMLLGLVRSALTFENPNG